MNLLLCSRPLTRLRFFSIAIKCRDYATDSRQHDPLRILFCGSDGFSIASLKPLVDLQTRNTDLIESIDILCRTDKLTGRGNKLVRQVPIKSAANDLGLSIHQLDSFDGIDSENWKDKFNLIVAVSFGLLIPSRLIESAQYGGLNVHPSLLPDFRGASPIWHTLLHSRSHTGVTLQTLHPTKFDHGQILAQTPLPGIPVPKNATVSVLKDVLSDAGAFMLRDVIESGAFLTPFKPISHTAQDIDLITNGKGVARAPKTTKADTEIHWSQMTASEILHRFRISDGYGWDQTAYGTLGEEKCRIIYISLKETTPDLTRDIDPNLSPGVPCFLSGDSERDRRRIGVKAKDGVVLEVVNCKVAGRGTSSGMNELCRLLEHRGG